MLHPDKVHQHKISTALQIATAFVQAKDLFHPTKDVIAKFGMIHGMLAPAGAASQ